MKYLIIFLISMVPIIELRGAMIYAVGYDLPYIPALITCVIGNMLPVPIIYFFARKVLQWGANKKYIGKLFTFFLVKGERAGQKLVKTAGRGGLFIALLLFVGIPLPGTGAWMGALIAALLDMRMKYALPSIFAGVVLAAFIMSGISYGFSTTGHTGIMLPIYLYGTGAESINGVMDNTELAKQLMSLMGWE